jgi:hypothetical protein
VIYEVDNDLYGSVPVPPISGVVGRCAASANDSQKFLAELCPDAQVKRIWATHNQDLFQRSVTQENLETFVTDLRGAMDELAVAAFSNREIASLPAGVKRQLNLLIFHAVSSKVHYMLMMAFNAAYESANKSAQAASRRFPQTVAVDRVKMEAAVRQFHGILHRPNPVAIIESLVVFFDGMVAALPGVEVAADDILPAICLAMTRDVGFGSHVVSFFNYLSEIWPPVGMDERVTYILVTCAIAAQHLASSQGQAEAVVQRQPQKARQNDKTVDMLEDLLKDI